MKLTRILRPGLLIMMVIIVVAVYILRSSSLNALIVPIDKEQHTLGNYTGHGKVLVEFWASWCHFCEHQVSTLNLFHKDFPNAQIIGVQIDDGIPGSLFQAATYPSLHSVDDSAKPIMRHYGNYAGVVPFIVILDDKGAMLDRFAGETSLNDLERLFR